MSKLKSKFLYLLAFIGIGVSFSYAQEPVKGINYLGEENGVRSYCIECSNGKSGYLYKDMVSHTIQIEVDGEMVEFRGCRIWRCCVEILCIRRGIGIY